MASAEPGTDETIRDMSAPVSINAAAGQLSTALKQINGSQMRPAPHLPNNPAQFGCGTNVHETKIDHKETERMLHMFLR